MKTIHPLEPDFDSPELVSCLDELSFWSAPFGMKILDLVRYGPSIHALDLACGTRFPLIELAMRLGPGSQVSGLDPWQVALDRAKSKIGQYGPDNISLFHAEAENMPFFADTFDLIVSNNGLNNVRNIEQALSECYRVARPGAQFIWSMNTDDSFAPFYKLYRSVLRDHKLTGALSALEAHIYNKRPPVHEMKEKTESAGFRILDLHPASFSYRFSSGTAMFAHAFIRLAFMQAWLKIPPPEYRERVFSELESGLNKMAAETGGLEMPIPFVVFECVKM